MANDRVDFDLRRGEVHALLGENGAGKSTLMSVLYGLYRPDEGELRLGGEPVTIDSPRRAIELGIGMVHQHFMLVPVMTVAENIVLASEPRKGLLLDTRAAERRVRELSDRFGLAVDPSARVGDISVGQQQRVEILRALDRGAEVLILDEPTAVLTAQETAELFKVLRTLTGRGQVDRVHLAQARRGARDLRSRQRPAPRQEGRDGADRGGDRGEPGAHDGRPRRPLPGQQGAERAGPAAAGGRRTSRWRTTAACPRSAASTSRCTRARSSGSPGSTTTARPSWSRRSPGCGCRAPAAIRVDGRDVTHADVRGKLAAGIGHIAEDRHRRGLVLDFNLAENLCLRDYTARPDRPARADLAEAHERARGAAARGVRRARRGPARRSRPSLSGGNQQKVVIAREIAEEPKVLIAAQPTRGLDVGAIEFVHRRLIEQRDAGRGVLLVSLELEEIRSLSDRVLVIYDGRIVAELAPEASEEEFGVAMLGGRREAA